MNFLADLHFLRPLWPLAVLPVLALLAWSASRPKHGDGGWGGVIDDHLLQPLLVGRLAESRLMRRLLAALALVLTAVALAGPAWQQLPQPVLQNSRGLVMVMDLSPSMLVNDVPPSRLDAAKFKLRDVLGEFNDRPTGLIAFAGSAHVVAPISNDGNTVENLLRSLSPGMMPVPGSRIAPALLRADELLRDGGGLRGDVLLITDSKPNSAAFAAAEKLADDGHRLTVLGIGTADGSPIPDGEGGFLRDRSQRIVIAKLPRAELRRLALAGSGVYRDLATSGDDLSLLRNDSGEWLNNGNEDGQLSSDGWQDEGVWLLLPVLLLVAVGARKGLLFSLLPAAAISLALIQSAPVLAQPADDAELAQTQAQTRAEAEPYSETPLITPLFSTANQRGQRALQSNSPERAAELFNNPAWRATALYRAGKYEEAAAAFTKMPGAAGEYNQGNALAKSGNLEAAKEAYERALAAKPNYADAAANLELVNKLLEQQQEQQKQEDSENGEQDKDKEEQDNQESEDGAQQDRQQGGEESESQSGEQSQGEQSKGQQSQDQNNGQPNDDQQTNDAEQNNASESEQQAEEQKQQAEKQQADEKSPEEQAAEKLAAEKAAEQAKQEGDQRAVRQADQQQPMDEQQQALQQWLNRIPDDPGGLLRRKFARQQQRQQQMGQQLEADGEAGW